MTALTQQDRLALLLINNGFTFEENGDLNKPKDCTQFHQNLLLTIFINHGLDLVNGRYRLSENLGTVAPERELVSVA